MRSIAGCHNRAGIIYELLRGKTPGGADRMPGAALPRKVGLVAFGKSVLLGAHRHSRTCAYRALGASGSGVARNPSAHTTVRSSLTTRLTGRPHMEIQELLQRMGEHLSVRRAFGKPIDTNGVVIIPVALVAGGGGGGEGPATPPRHAAGVRKGTEESKADRRASEQDRETGSGGGFGGVVLPLGVYVIKGDRVSWKPALDVTVVALMGIGVLRLLIRLRSRARLQRGT
jgi:uncharacterized spore protein YtfJ